MQVISAVVQDLYRFVVKYHFGFVDTTETRLKELPAPTKVAESTPNTNAFSPHSTTPVHDARTEVPSTVNTLFQVGYAAELDTHLHVLPTRTFDGVVCRLPYGTSLQIINAQGKWRNVAYGDMNGWVHEDQITESKAQVVPRFTPAVVYDAQSHATVALRTMIDDRFHAGALEVPLSDVEYVSYRLLRHGQEIEWPPVRPRIAGTWQKILKGVAGVHIGVHPKKDAVMEYIYEDNTGHVAYVESVYPDESITISDIGHAGEGEFSERTLVKEEWRELRPVFIEVA